MSPARVGFSIAVVGLLVIASATLFPTPGAPSIPHGCLICGQAGGVDAVLNVLLFMPLGIGLGVRGTRVEKGILLVVATTALVEFLQLAVVNGRSATLGDLVTNTAGGALGYAVGHNWRLFVSPHGGVRHILVVAASLGFAAMMAFTGYSLQPAPTSGTFFGHHVRGYGSEQPFPGKVRLARLGKCVVTNSSADDQGCIHAAVMRGDTFAVDLTAQGIAPGPAAVVRVVDARQNEVASMGGDRERAIFSVRTKASAMGFRAYRFALDSVFEHEELRDVRLAGTFVPSAVTISASGPGLSRRTTFRLGPASAWRIFIPFRYYDDGSFLPHFLDKLWLAGLLFPMGYWSARLARQARNELPIIAAALTGALLICPVVFNTAPPSASEVVAGLVGIVTGIGARRLVQGVVFDSPK
jgi:hypothetical protein